MKLREGLFILTYVANIHELMFLANIPLVYLTVKGLHRDNDSTFLGTERTGIKIEYQDINISDITHVTALLLCLEALN